MVRPVAAWVLCAGLLLAGCISESAQSLVASGKALSEKRDYRAAVVQFKSALQKDGNSLEIRHLLGKALLDAGDPTNALVELGKALDQQAPPDALRADHAKALLHTGDLKKLVAQYAETALVEPAAQASLQASMANAWGALGDRKKAENAATAALAAQPDFGPALTLQARLLASAGNTNEAIAVLEQLLAREPNQYEAWHLLGEIRWHSKRDGAAATQALKQAVAAKPTHLPSHLALVQVQLAAKDFAAAKMQVNSLRQALPNHPHATFVEAQIAFLERNYERARELVLQLLQGSPNHQGTLQLAGAIEGQSGSLAMARHYYGKVLQINPELIQARRSLAHTQLRLGQPSQALSTLQPALVRGGGGAEEHALAGEAQLLLGDSQAAETSFKRAASLAPDNVRVRTALALSALARGEASSAFSELDSLAAQGPDATADLALISARLKRNETELALAAAQNLLRKQPQNAAAAHMVGRLQLLKRDRTAARQAFEQALKIDPQYFGATASLAALDVAEQRPEQARRRFDDAIKRDPRNHLARQALAELRLSEGAPAQEVDNILADAIKANPTEASPRLLLISRLLSAQQHKDALVVAQGAAAALPNDPAILDALGRAQAESGDRGQAVATFKKLAAMDPTSGLAHVRLADVYKLNGDPQAAEASLKKALDLQPDLLPAQNSLLDLLLASNRHRDALDVGLRLQRRHPALSTGYLLEAAVHLRQRAIEPAIEAYRKGLAQVANSSELATALHKALVANKRWAEADQLAAKWSAAHPEDLAFDYQLAMAAISRGNLDAAEKGLQRLVARRPNHALALNNLAWVLVVRGKPGAVELARKATDILPGRPALMDTLAMALAADNKLPEALELQKRAVTLAPADSGLRFNLAKIAVQAGDKELARKELKALEAVGSALPLRDEVLKLLAGL